MSDRTRRCLDNFKCKVSRIFNEKSSIYKIDKSDGQKFTFDRLMKYAGKTKFKQCIAIVDLNLPVLHNIQTI